MTNTLTSKPMVLVLMLMSASVILISGSRVWVSGSAGDAVLGASVLHGRGSDIAPGALAAALVGLASAVAAATAGTVVRVIAAWSAMLAAVLGVVVIISVLADPGGVLGTLAAAGTGRSGSVVAHGQAGSWAWVALSATLVMGFGGLCALVGASRWNGLSSRFDPPVAGHSSQSSQTSQLGSTSDLGRRREVEWDQLSRGEDPTVEK
ncbi:MAG TPA: Trp biosynthesis-associated membrane protein [Dermatophilaceae bacterium]